MTISISISIKLTNLELKDMVTLKSRVLGGLPFSIKARWEVTFEGSSDSSPKNIRFTPKKSPSTGVSW
jgi:hypothetical protein